jgi:hypothetical protein
LKKDIRTVLGNSDSYFGQSEQPTGTESPSIEFLLEEYDPFSHQNGLYVVIEAAGIGPGGGSIDYVHPSGVYVNSTLYDFSDSWPYWADERAARVQGRFAIRISANDLTEGTNTIKFVGGQYRGIGDRVEIDNYIVFSFAVATLAQ